VVAVPGVDAQLADRLEAVLAPVPDVGAMGVLEVPQLLEQFPFDLLFCY
jgi:hypothetical protein